MKTGDLAMREIRESQRRKREEAQPEPVCVRCGNELPYLAKLRGDEMCEQCEQEEAE